MWFRILLVALVIGAVVGLLLRLARPRPIFELQTTPDGVSLKGSVPGLGDATAVEFVASLALPAGSRVRGLPSPEGFQLEFSPDVPRGEHQRLRNFLYQGRPRA